LDITQLILDDHHEQRRLFSMLDQIADGDARALTAVWGRLHALLDVHAETEERLFYPALLKLKRTGGPDTTDETVDAIKDHNDIRDTAEAVDAHPVGSAEWRKAVAACNKANSEHMNEEEREGLTDFRRHAPLQQRHELAVQFATHEAESYAGVKPVDIDPKTYIAENS